nr:MAG TPA: hypothetical protein [Caudoviricetes sp.]
MSGESWANNTLHQEQFAIFARCSFSIMEVSMNKGPPDIPAAYLIYYTRYKHDSE